MNVITPRGAVSATCTWGVVRDGDYEPCDELTVALTTVPQCVLEEMPNLPRDHDPHSCECPTRVTSACLDHLYRNAVPLMNLFPAGDNS